MMFADILHALLHIVFNMQKYTFFLTYQIFLLFFINKVIKQVPF